MYEIVKSVLNQGKYSLTDIVRKIDNLWVKGDLSDQERDNLLCLAREGAKTENSLDILKKLDELEKRVRVLEENINESEDTTQTLPEYQNGKWYYTGDKISFEGENYTCIAPQGQVCVWSPKDYPAYWRKTLQEV